MVTAAGAAVEVGGAPAPVGVVALALAVVLGSLASSSSGRLWSLSVSGASWLGEEVVGSVLPQAVRCLHS